MNGGEEIKPGSDSRKNWKEINANSGTIREILDDLAQLHSALRQLRRPGTDNDGRFLPFEIYRPPFPSDADRAGGWWRTFFVRHGYVNAVKTEGCTDDDDEGVTPVTITLASGVTDYFVWIEVTFEGNDVDSCQILHGADGWDDFPNQSGEPNYFYILLAKITTDDTYAIADIHQYSIGNQVIGGVGGGSGLSVWRP